MKPLTQIMNNSLPISSSYRTPIFEAVALQAILGILSLMILDDGDAARICGIALIAFWGGVTILIYRRPKSPSTIDIQLIRFGYLPLAVVTGFLVHLIWHMRGFE